MPANDSPVLGLPLIQPSQSQKHVTHNEALKRLDVLVHLVVSSRSTATPPADPPEGRRQIVPENATGAWVGQTDKLAVYQGGAWAFLDPLVGWQAYVKDEDTFITFTSTGWALSATQMTLQNIDQLGINTTADGTNRLSVASDASLMTHDGNDHRLKVNKNAAGDTASLLFQSGFTGHAEMGLAGSTDFSIRVSADGSVWTTALGLDAGTGAVSAPEGLEVSGALTGSGIVGTVSESGGVSSGAIFEQGSNANGSYVKFANGLMIMRSAGLTVSSITTTAGGTYISPAVSWSYPASPVVGSIHMMASGDDNRIWGCANTPNSGNCSFRLMSYTNTFNTARTVNAVAFCRWF